MIKDLKPVTIHLKYDSNLEKTERLVKRRHKKRIQKKLLNKLGYPFFRYSICDGHYQMYMYAKNINDKIANFWNLEDK